MAEVSETSLLPAETSSDDLACLKALVLDGVSSPHSRRAYEKALDDFLGWRSRAVPQGCGAGVSGEARDRRPGGVDHQRPTGRHPQAGSGSCR